MRQNVNLEDNQDQILDIEITLDLRVEKILDPKVENQDHTLKIEIIPDPIVENQDHILKIKINPNLRVERMIVDLRVERIVEISQDKDVIPYLHIKHKNGIQNMNIKGIQVHKSMLLLLIHGVYHLKYKLNHNMYQRRYSTKKVEDPDLDLDALEIEVTPNHKIKVKIENIVDQDQDVTQSPHIKEEEEVILDNVVHSLNKNIKGIQVYKHILLLKHGVYHLKYKINKKKQNTKEEDLEIEIEVIPNHRVKVKIEDIVNQDQDVTQSP